MDYVEKVRLPVRLAQPGLPPTDGFLMLVARMEHEQRPETLMELVNAPRIVLPFIGTNEHDVALLVRANIDWVAVGRDGRRDLLFPPGHRVTHGQRMQLSFTNEDRIEALVQWDRTDPRVRLSDFLNACADFFPVVASFGTLFVNRQRVRQMRIADEAPQPLHDPAQGAGLDPGRRP